jgi:hypothetical protein
MRRELFLLAFLLLSSPAFATTYYVSQTHGNDTFTGTAPTHTTASTGPWKTLARVNAGPFAPGDSILFERGDTWRELLTVPSSGSSGNPITFGAYGTGSRPTLTGADLVTSWAVIAPQIYVATLATRPVAVWFDGRVGTGKVSGGALAADGDWLWSSNALYIFSSTVPSAQVVEASSRGTVYMSGKRWVTLEQLTFTKGGNELRDGKSIAIRQSANIVLRDCDVTDSVNIGVDVFAVDGLAGDATIERCAFARTGMSKDPGGAHSAIQTYNTTDAPTFLFQHNTFQDIDPYGGSLGHGIYAQSGKVIWRYNQHKGDSGPARAGAAVRLATTGGSQVYGNTFSNEGGRRRWGILATAGVHYVFNNVFYENNYGILTDTGNPTIIAHNNIWFGSPSDTWFYVSIQAGTYRGDNNIFFGAANGWLVGEALTGSLAQWQASSGQDVRSLSTDPLFVSTSDFRLQRSSPAIDAGVDVGLTEDLAGTHVPQGLAPDIGAYEWRPAGVKRSAGTFANGSGGAVADAIGVTAWAPDDAGVIRVAARAPDEAGVVSVETCIVR